jgi:hypothetical protein
MDHWNVQQVEPLAPPWLLPVLDPELSQLRITCLITNTRERVMRINCVLSVVLMVLLGVSAQASEPFGTEKIKTGILPTGGFYSLFEVDCGNEVTGVIASLKGGTSWCTSYVGEMSCFTSKQESSASACMTSAVAVADDRLNDTDKYQ